MKITRAIGLALFIFIIQFALRDVFQAFSDSLVAGLETFETASQTATVQLRTSTQ